MSGQVQPELCVAERLRSFSPKTYGLRPTALHRLDRVSPTIGREVWIKRDDLISVGAGGNKMRKLGFLVAAAIRSGADHLVTVGAAQSNHARCVAAVAAIEGLGCDLVLGGAPDTEVAGNLLLDHMLGARVHLHDTRDWDELEKLSGVVADERRAQGKRPYVMPIGGSTPIGALGFVDAYLELRSQLDALDLRPAAIVHATSSGGTQAGLAVGAASVGDDVKILGVGVAKTNGDLVAEVSELIEGCVKLLGAPLIKAPEVAVLDGYMGGAYGEPTAGAQRAMRLLFRREGILVDPVYTAKALHAVIEAPTLGDGPIVFWHTGGTPALFAFKPPLVDKDAP